jgi:hypothetical protein
MALSKSKKRFGGITERTDPFRGRNFPNASEARLSWRYETYGFVPTPEAAALTTM